MSTRQARRRQQRVAQRSGRPARRTASTPWYLTPWAFGGAVAIVAVVIIAIVVAGQNKGSGNGGPFHPVVAPASVVNPLTKPAPSVLAAVKSGGQKSPWTAQKAPILKVGGKPLVFYYGAEYCPYCAATRWSLIAALSRFGTFSGLRTMKSAGNDTFPNTSTFTFVKSNYVSPYLTFQPREVENRARLPLQQPTSLQSTLVSKYNGGQSFPFVDAANQATFVGLPPSIDENVFRVNGNKPLTWQQISTMLKSPKNAVTKTVFGQANWMTAQICAITKNTPSKVCTAAPIPALEKQLGK